MMKAIGRVVMVPAVLVLAAGCGAGATRHASEPTDRRPASQRADDDATVGRTVLRLSDLPAGWAATPSTDDPSAPPSKAGEKRFAGCLKVDPSLFGAGAGSDATAQSDDFSDTDDHEVSSSVTLTTADRARSVLQAVGKPEATGCLEAFVNDAVRSTVRQPKPGDELPAGITLGKAEVVPLSLPVHAESAAYRTKVPVSVEGQSLDAWFDMVLSLRGRVGATMTFISFGEPFPASLAADLVNKVVDRAPPA